MLTFHHLKGNVLDAIAALIGDRLSGGAFSKLRGQWELAESMAITEMPIHQDKLAKIRPNFRGHWFHLLKCADEYIGFAISTPIGPAETDWMIESVSVAKLSKQIARAITWIDKHLDDGTVRILVDQRHHLHALTIDNGEQMWAVVAHLPRKIAIRKRVIYPWPKLLDLLTKESPVCGISARRRAATSESLREHSTKTSSEHSGLPGRGRESVSRHSRDK
jgi:hypothetical protein